MNMSYMHVCEYVHTGHVSIVILSLTQEIELTAPLGPAGSHFFPQV